MKIINPGINISIVPSLKTTSEFNDIIFGLKPSKKSLDISKEENFYVLKILENTYETITFQNLNPRINKDNALSLYKKKDIIPDETKPSLYSQLYDYKSNIISFAGVQLFPAIKGFDIETLTTDTYSGGLKYYNLGLNKYYRSLTNKKILIIKQIGPREIVSGVLMLYFNEEHFLSLKNKTKTIFIYDDWGTGIKYDDINVTSSPFEYYVSTSFSDKKIRSHMPHDCDHIFIDKFSIHKRYECVDDLSIIPTYLNILNHCLNILPITASLTIMGTLPYSFAHRQLYYYLYTIFTYVTYHKSKLSSLKSGYFIFHNRTTTSNILEGIINEYNGIDIYNGTHTYVPRQNKTWCNSPQRIRLKPKLNVYIKRLYKEPILDEFDTFINAIFKKRKTSEKLFIQRINYIKDLIVLPNGKININKIKTIVLNNIEESISYLSRKNIGINEIYIKNDIATSSYINSSYLIKSCFPMAPENIRKNIILSRDSIYSVSSYSVAEKTSGIIKKTWPKCSGIIDGCANIGGNTYNFSKNYATVLANEYSKSTYANLVHNVSILKLRNTYLFNDDIVKLMKDTKFMGAISAGINTWCLYLDPPWSGVFYKLETNIDLFLSGINIISFIKGISIRNICIKVPKNYNLVAIFDAFDDVQIYKVEYCFIICITKHIV